SDVQRRFQVLTHGERSSSVFTKEFGVFTYELELPKFLENSEAGQSEAGSFDGRSIISPMPALVEKLAVAPGDTVRNGDTIAILTAMKMEHVIRAAFDDEDQVRTVEKVFFKQGDSVAKGAKLV